MKLLTKTSLWYLSVTAVILFAGSLVFFYSLRHALDEEVTENIYGEKARVESYFAEHDSIPDIVVPLGDEVSYAYVKGPPAERVYDTIMPNPDDEDEPSPYRRLIFGTRAGQQYVRVVISKPMFESEDLLESIGNSLLILGGALLLALFLLNRYLFRSLWNPFYRTMRMLHRFDTNNADKLLLPETGTAEFRALNEALQKMSQTIAQDFRNLKTFTENAAHELQTPLAIIRSKAELLLQSGELSEEASLIVQQIFNAAHRLSKINNALLLLAKIENHQYAHAGHVDLSALLQEKLDFFADLMESKSLTLRTGIEPHVMMQLHPQLADILLSNLIVNAIRHTAPQGLITVSLSPGRFEIANSGLPLQTDPEKLFERFHKENPDSDSAGLGLAIVQSIADTSSMRARYRYEAGMHVFSIFSGTLQNTK